MIVKLKKKLFLLYRYIFIVFIFVFLFYYFNRFSDFQNQQTNNNLLRNYLLGYLKNLSSDDLNKIFLKNLSESNFKDINTLDLLHVVIKLINQNQLILNNSKFKNYDIVIVIQVHNRINYLKILINSLSNVKEIENALLIFSHDFFNIEINQLIRNIKFCKVTQIFYPFSLQLYPNNFPGTDKKDCPRNLYSFISKIIKCNNADYPDHFGHYREAKFTQTKHHWFWKINYVFDKFDLTKNFDGLFLFLEEDNYVFPDLLYILKMLHSENLKQNQVEIISMGAYFKNLENLKKYNNYAINLKWISVRHNMGMAFTRKQWKIIKNCARQFCQFDDYNWDWSLEYISKTCLKTPLRTTNMIFPRVIHIGECGIHHKKNCNNQTLINYLNTTLTSDLFFSKTIQLKVLKFSFNKKKKQTINGGWSDIRDHQLCLNFTL